MVRVRVRVKDRLEVRRRVSYAHSAFVEREREEGYRTFFNFTANSPAVDSSQGTRCKTLASIRRRYESF